MLVGGRLYTKFVITSRLQTYVQEMGCKLVQKGKILHKLCDYPEYGSRGPMGPGKVFLNGVRKHRRVTQPLG